MQVIHFARPEIECIYVSGSVCKHFTVLSASLCTNFSGGHCISFFVYLMRNSFKVHVSCVCVDQPV